jgi:predicted PhzF superfamily epimerase YddE/YHI9
VGRERTFAHVDVFAATPYGGNPVAVVLDGDGLTDTDMARFAQWSFFPHGELPFAGHPTLGSVHAWLEHGGKPGDGGTSSCSNAA